MWNCFKLSHVLRYRLNIFMEACGSSHQKDTTIEFCVQQLVCLMVVPKCHHAGTAHHMVRDRLYRGEVTM